MVKSWVATHTGLPSFYSPSPVRIIASGGRVLSDGTGPVMVSDPLTAPGVPTIYQVDSQTVTLTRRAGDWWAAEISTLTGRSVAGVAWDGDGDQREWESTVSILPNGGVRWAMRSGRRKGKGTFTLTDATREDEVMRVLEARTPLILSPGKPTPGLPPRIIVVSQVGRKRISGDGTLELSVSWTEYPVDSALVRSHTPAPVVTWGEWMEYRERSGDLADHSYLELARLIAGMSS